eukprot:GILJ01002499.1.p1 GENE.GILJ01002499.1~~GILJ01002499.1.p1  ORF type:complete len:314 (-),score=31.12 GILJ01002499.1:35-928(-)
MASSFRLALCQMSVGADKAANLVRAHGLIQKAAQNGANVIVLPEIFNSPYSNASFPVYAEPIPVPPSGCPEGAELDLSASPSVKMIVDAAKETNTYIIGGSLPEREGDRLYNTSVIADRTGRILAKHRKVHLFDIDIPGKMTFRESDTLTAGNQITVVDTEYGKFGVAICYDLRFPELAQSMSKKGARVLLYPGAFNTTTGPRHWELLQRGRAVDNQCYVAACSPARSTDPSDYQAWGHSTVVGPWGDIIATTEHEEDIVYANIDMTQVDQFRQQVPILAQKRHDLYALSILETTQQ